MELIITAKNAGRRLDRFLSAFLNDAPHSFIYKMLRKKRIKLNAGRAHGSEVLSEGDVLRFFLSHETIAGFRKGVYVPEAQSIPEIVFEDENLLVVNKPAGLPSQGGMGGKEHLLMQLLFYLQKKGDYPPNADFTPGICNRLDVNTSGLVVCGKNLKTLQELNSVFKNRSVDKEYLAVVDGVAGKPGEKQTLRNFYAKDESTRTARVVDGCKLAGNPLVSGGGILLAAILSAEKKITFRRDLRLLATENTNSEKGVLIETAYTVIAVCKTHSLLKVSPITGRFHQIRAHLAHIGLPLSGDKKYGGNPNPFAKHQLLHCHRLSIPKLSMYWEADLPVYFSKCISELFGEVNTQ